jgi:hypothetical protein
VLSGWAFLAVRRGLTSVGADGIAVHGAFRVRRSTRCAPPLVQERAVVGALLVFFAAIGYLVWTVSVDDGHRLLAFLLLPGAPLATYAFLVTLFRLRSSRTPAHA